jgi:NNMT/PNMT/TEMT family
VNGVYLNVEDQSVATLDVTVHGDCPFGLHLSKTKRWLITLAATAASTYTLDAVATAAGLILVASHALRDLDGFPAHFFLASTYLVWGAGLRLSLTENWALLERTGMSANVLSKIAYDIFKRRTKSERVQKFVADAGYVGAELAKEAPYYVGAIGFVLLSDSVTATEAIIFLGGANLGAAAYEYGLARMTRAFLCRANAPAYASFEADWAPRQYLADYYSTVESDERQTIAFFVEAMRHSASDEPILIFGVGPTLHHVFLAAGRDNEIHLGDYLPANLAEIERWINRDADAHNWGPFVRHTLACEGLAFPTDEDVARREEAARAKISKLLEVDLRRAHPLGEAVPSRYATVISAYCADSATSDKVMWAEYMARIANLVRPGGMLITAALRRTSGYLVGDKLFPSAGVDEDDLRRILEPIFGSENLVIEVCDLPDASAKNYASIVLAQAHKSPSKARVD